MAGEVINKPTCEKLGGGVAKQGNDPCCSKKTDMPSTPLWLFGKAAKKGDKESLKKLQDAVDYLTCKGKNQLKFELKESHFMKEVFESFSWGGWWLDWPEAANLSEHYVNGGGEKFVIDEEVYTTSVIVSDVVEVMKGYIKTNIGKAPLTIKSNDDKVWPLMKPLLRGNRNQNTEGIVWPDSRVIMAEQNNKRLKNADNRFYLNSISQKTGKTKITTVWSVKNIYDFVSFDTSSTQMTNKDYKNITVIPLGSAGKLKIPDGLSHYITTSNGGSVAKEFDYEATWEEVWE